MFTLAISSLTTSNLTWFVDLTFQGCMQYCSLRHQTLLPSPTHINNWALFWLRLHLFFLSGVISSLFSSSILGIYWPGEFIFQCHIFLPFHSVHDVLKARILKWFAAPSPVDLILSELCTMTCPSWVALHSMVHSFIELARLWSMWSVWLVFCDCGSHSICPLMDKYKRHMETSWLERLTEGESGSYLDGRGHAQ